MKRYILTGTPGCGKTSVLEALAARGVSVVAEAATDFIAQAHAVGEAEPHRSPTFTEKIAALQRERRLAPPPAGARVQLHDRSVVCTKALALYLGRAVGPILAGELKAVAEERAFENEVFFLDNLGFVAPTAARRITFADALVFERVHEEAYEALGYRLVRVAKASIAERAAYILDRVGGR